MTTTPPTGATGPAGPVVPIVDTPPAVAPVATPPVEPRVDPRGIGAFALAGIALVGIVILQAVGKLDDAVLTVLSGVATGGMALAFGLYSVPRR